MIEQTLIKEEYAGLLLVVYSELHYSLEDACGGIPIVHGVNRGNVVILTTEEHATRLKLAWGEHVHLVTPLAPFFEVYHNSTPMMIDGENRASFEARHILVACSILLRKKDPQ